MGRYKVVSPPLGMTEQQYAEHCGCSRSGVRKARLYGRLVLHLDGSIDAKASDRRWAETTVPRMRLPSVGSCEYRVSLDQILARFR